MDKKIKAELKKLFPKKVPRILIYDIETTPLKGWLWRCGDITMRHAQLDVAYNEYGIICIAYKWLGDNKTHILSDENMIVEFDKVVKQAEVTLGKNSDRFDVKHINTQRLMQNLPPCPEWMDTTDDLEKQLRKYFVFPSMSLDYISNLFGQGGKVKMEFQDWIDIANYNQFDRIQQVLHPILGVFSRISILKEAIAKILYKDSHVNIVKKGLKAFKKMLYYNKKDVDDTEAALIRVLPHIKLKYNHSVRKECRCCITCGSTQITADKVIHKGKTRYQQFHCEGHGGYAGKCTFTYSASRNKRFGKVLD